MSHHRPRTAVHARRPVLAAGLSAAAVAVATAVVPSSSPAAPVSGRSEADNIRVVKRFYAAFNSGDVSLLDRTLAPAWKDVPLPPGQPAGRDGIKPTITGTRAALPDLKVRIDSIFAKGDRVVVRETFTGTQTGGPFLGVPVTGRKISFRAADTHLVRNGRITTTWHVEDFYGALVQLGGAPR